ncbi:MAG: SDR family oxidoreductase [Flavobacteriaceae bacterium]
MKLNLKNKYALVCGSTQGIGKATAKLLAEEGANITLVARNEEKLQEVLAELPTNGQQHYYVVADFSNPTELQQKVTEHLKKIGQCHILINNTGGPPSGTVLNASLDEFEIAFTRHLKCNQVLAQAVIPYMKEASYGRIVNIISTSVKEPIEDLGVSNTIRGAVGNWSKTLAAEVAKFNITVNNVLPGFTKTERLMEIIKVKAEKEYTSVEKMAEMMKNYAPIERFAEPQEVANAIVFLASEAASYITGINVPVDGGRTKSL